MKMTLRLKMKKLNQLASEIIEDEENKPVEEDKEDLESTDNPESDIHKEPEQKPDRIRDQEHDHKRPSGN